MLKFDLHMHSYYSFDSLNPPEKIVETAIRKGLDGIAVTDHNVNRIDWDALQKKYPQLIIIPGIEVGTAGTGDILCYFIRDELSIKDPYKLVDTVHEKNGLAVLAHPYHHRKKSFSYDSKLLKSLDCIETGNAHNLSNTEKAFKLADEFSKPYTGGSDAHCLYEIGNGITLLDITKKEAEDENKLKQAILNAQVIRPSNSIISVKYSFIFSQSVKYLKKFHLIKENV